MINRGEITIRNKRFILVEDTQAGRHFFGTIPMENVDENGKVTKQMNGFAMCVKDTKDEAVKGREFDMLVDEWHSEHKDASTEELIAYMMRVSEKVYGKKPC